MENKAHALLAGAFTLGLLIAAAAIAMWLTGERHERVPYELATKLSIPGLNPQAAVRYRGLDVGKVDSIDFDPNVPGQILVKIGVKPDTPITKSTFGTLGYQGVTGIAYIELNDEGSNPVRLRSSEAHLARIEMRPSLIDNLQTRGLAILNEAEELTRRVNRLMEPANQQRMLTAFDNISKAAAEVETIPRQLQPTLAKLPAMADRADRALTTVSTLANNLNGLTTTLQGPNGTVSKLTTTIDDVGMAATKLEVEAVPLARDMRSTLREFNRTMNAVRENPQSLLFGVGHGEPGPGEAGYQP